MLTWIEALVFFIMLACTFYGFFQPLYLRYKLVIAAKPENRFDKPVKRFIDAVTSMFFLRCSVKKERLFTGLIHIFILYGSLTFDTVTVNHILEGFNPEWNFFGHGGIRHFYSAWTDFFGIMVLLATLYFIIRRYVVRPKSYSYNTHESAVIYGLLITVTLTFFLYEGAAIAHAPNHAYSAFVGKAIAGWMQSAGLGGWGWVKVNWWLHIINVFLFIVYVPRSKYLHMIFGPINIAFKNYHSTGLMKPLDLDMDNAQVFGVVQATDYTWKDVLDGLTCIDCGRCEDYCPAAQSGKSLTPKNLMLKLKQHLFDEKNTILQKKTEELPPLMNGTYTEEEIWSCTTCGACMEVCPVKNEHIPKVTGLRQSQVLMESKFPEQLNLFFRNIETNSNPWGFGSSTRAEWADDLAIKTLSQDPNVDLLFWVGCAGSFDERSKKVTQSVVKILQAAGVNFGILGLEENCCGDQARRLGNEYLFQMLAQQNIETLAKYNVKKVLVTCPHGYNTFKNDYPELAKKLGMADWNIEVVHHSQFITDLIRDGKLKLSTGSPTSSLTYHDPCYLGRHNDIFNPPRTALTETGAKIVEMKHNHTHSFCCGAGGGLMWTEESSGQRVNEMRTKDALGTGASTIATACPFCLTMLEDGLKTLEKEENCTVRDIAEIIAQRL
ncbi:MAG: heterodisulfide reductase-related iron-sulfur binding cluster [Candidatus Omnitrophota bacterium]